MHTSRLNFTVFNQYTTSIALQTVVTDPHNVEFQKMSLLSNSMLMHYLTAPVHEKREVLLLMSENFKKTIEILESQLNLVVSEINDLEPVKGPLSNAES